VPNFAADTIDLAGPNSWPMTSATFILLPTDPPAEKVEASRNSMRFFDWAYRNGSQIASSLEYIPLPAPAHDLIRAAWRTEVKAPNGSAIWSA
jgi:phosphate transport system substrate-binding protein